MALPPPASASPPLLPFPLCLCKASIFLRPGRASPARPRGTRSLRPFLPSWLRRMAPQQLSW
eukprot:2248790-Rhodomonas_salina.1